jgi:integrase
MTVFRRGSIYYYDFILKGTRFAGTTRTKNRRGAEKFEADVRKREEGRINAASGKAPGSITLADAMKRLYTERWSRLRDAKKILARSEKIVGMLGADTPLSAIDSPKISQMAATLRSSGLKDSSVNRYFATLKTLLLTAQREWEAIPSIPYIKLAKEPLGRLRTFSVEEEEQIQTLLREKATPLHTEVANLFILLADSGMRLSEGLRLEGRDINLKTDSLHIWVSKGNRPRSIPLTARMRALLTPRLTVDGRIFQFKSTHQVERVWNRTIKWTGRQDVGSNGANPPTLRPEFAGASIHTYRHSYASRLVQLGVPLYTVQSLMGHSTPLMTQRYAHLSPESFKQSAQLLDSLLKSK